MNRKIGAIASAAVLAIAGSAGAVDIEDELAAIKARLAALEKQVQEQKRVIAEKDAEIQAIKRNTPEILQQDADAWHNRISVGGLIEVEAGYVDSDGANTESDIVAATVELGITAQVNDWVSAELVLLYEEDTDGTGNPFDVDTALVTIADPDSSWFVNAGQYTLPFGTYATNMVSDPLTLDLGETGDTAVEAGMGFRPLTASVYVFDGDRGPGYPSVDNLGFALNYEGDFDGVGVFGHVGYLGDVGETDGFGGLAAPADGDISGWIASAEVTAGNFVFIAEYLATLDDFRATAPGAEPSAYNLEVGYNFDIGGKPSVVAFSYQGTDDLDMIDPTLQEERIGAAMWVQILDGTAVALEYLVEEAYNGTDTNTLTGKVAVEF